ELINRLTHPRYEHEKEYLVHVLGHPDQATLSHWRRGVDLPDLDGKTRDGGRTAPVQVEIVRFERDPKSSQDGAWLRVVMHEGRKRQIRRVAKLLKHPVLQLVRVRIGPLKLGKLRPGQWRHLDTRERQELLTPSS
ncbi:MAG: rRNA pseudouridine synthase, partial [Thermoflexales bacterium]|nr:rRNA pseudouridine synthase [Thermoflexales bacterium]